jgi:hypothetical protein
MFGVSFQHLQLLKPPPFPYEFGYVKIGYNMEKEVYFQFSKILSFCFVKHEIFTNFGINFKL